MKEKAMRKAVFRLGLVVLAVMSLVALRPANAATACSGFSAPPVAVAFESITVSTTSIGFTSTVISPASGPVTYAVGTLETNPIRFRADGLAPSSTVGILVSAGQTIEVCGESNVKTFRAIRQGAADGTLQVHYYRVGQ